MMRLTSLHSISKTCINNTVPGPRLGRGPCEPSWLCWHHQNYLKKCLLCARMPVYGMAWSDETPKCLAQDGGHEVLSITSIRQELILFGGLWEDTWHSFMLIRKHLVLIGCLYTATCSLLCLIKFSHCKLFFSFFEENPTHWDLTLSLSLSCTFEKATCLNHWTNERDNCGSVCIMLLSVMCLVTQ